ncbi:MAG: F0F1 ATP synthase subunit A [Planctomycetes bacterium]|nr:F0F1 ATP synthase subunit A [Planctomycetota bacterium]
MDSSHLVRPLRRLPLRAGLIFALALVAFAALWPRSSDARVSAAADRRAAAEAPLETESVGVPSVDAAALVGDTAFDGNGVVAPAALVSAVVAPAVVEPIADPAAEGGEKAEGNVFITLYQHVVPHQLGPHHPLMLFGIPVWTPAEPVELFGLKVYDIQAYQLLAVLLIFVFFAGVAAKIRSGRPTVAGAFVQWIRDEMVYPAMGKENGQRYAPMFVALFFFIVIQNVVGLLPESSTPTASIFVTASLAILTFLGMLIFGMWEQGPIAYWKHIVPAGLPVAILPIMIPVELVGLVLKPFALMIRLFANMTAGHLVVLSFVGMIFYFQQQYGVAVGGILSPVWVGFGVFIMILESFVALLQAFLFTQLTILFVAASIHPEH